MTYRNQLNQIFIGLFNEAYVRAAGMSMALNAAAVHLFVIQENNSRRAFIVRKCIQLLDSDGYLDEQNLQHIFEAAAQEYP